MKMIARFFTPNVKPLQINAISQQKIHMYKKELTS